MYLSYNISDLTKNLAGENCPHPPAHDDLSGHLGALLVEDREVVGGHRPTCRSLDLAGSFGYRSV